MIDPIAQQIVDFWLQDSVDGPEQAERRREVWYRGGKPLDDAIAKRFSHEIEAALSGALNHWRSNVHSALALVIVLDQFTRNTFRSTPRAYAGDALALEVAQQAVANGSHQALAVSGRIFLYHPFHHAESLLLQRRGVELVDAIRHDVDASWHAYLDRRVAGFARHCDIVARFGRFPHRNAVLNRQNTPEEAAFLAADHDNFGQGPSQQPASS